MKKIVVLLFVMLVNILFATTNEYAYVSDPLRELKEKGQLDSLTTEQKEKVLVLKKEYFLELKEIQEKVKDLRNEANESMINNDEKKYEEIHDKMNELKLKKELAKENYRKKIKEILK
ncbi:hypothetical protein [Fusobacterium sp.]|uniref:Spy/CpxP family protein refolding chaperone n=1 Tax=Fusobacterium sp. TaxID=68766 RepID=UPI00262D570B|nr:hypothetical protein [Fusobacterium sp.]